MPSLVMRTVEESPEVPFPVQFGLRSSGTIHSRGVIGPERPILLWQHELAQGSDLEIIRPQVGHAFYVYAGGIEANNETVESGGAALVEHRGELRIRATSSGATLLHFHQRPAEGVQPPGAGGHVHIAGRTGVYQVPLGSGDGSGPLTVWADSGCPTCELWLHRANISGPRTQLQSHYHTDHEIIFFMRGEMIVGRSSLKPGTALAIDANTHYKFDTGPAGHDFINFRYTEPMFVKKQADGSHLSYNEREYVKHSGNTPATHIPATQRIAR